MWIVTGAEGFLGNTIVRQLLEQGEEVRACVYDTEAARFGRAVVRDRHHGRHRH
ncbi:hypothetical protein C3B44_07370 [Corynebacterium yudongzhengii]|uniref:NAD-dependent epimerase/dehydratase domain-containing protein n=1 Tax=Corynebacterium yudongzhengii TaxID=2080740 RepID=A0A2U1T6P6_9CORY|nr:hypothetical protein C3B44_07370 [Corynebacterium yudongzhengii]PWC01645.1 hypothetical protein DF222_05895 [Corynebacterium yudongzhengii]